MKAPKYDPCDPGNWRDGNDAVGDYKEARASEAAAGAPSSTLDVTGDSFWDTRPQFDTLGVPRLSLRELVREHYQHYFSRDKAAELAERHIDDIANTAPPAASGQKLTYPDEFTDDLQWILGLMCFQCISYAQALRKGGRNIATRAEAEQATTLDYLLRHYLRNPDNWRETASVELRAMMSSSATASDKEE